MHNVNLDPATLILLAFFFVVSGYVLGVTIEQERQHKIRAAEHAARRAEKEEGQ